MRNGLRLLAQSRRSGAAVRSRRRGQRRGGRLALCAGRKRRQLADVASADVLLRFDVRAHRDAHAPARRDGGIRLLLAPCAGDARPRRRKDEGIRLSDRDEILGVAAGAETQGYKNK